MDELQRDRYLTEKIIDETIRHGPITYRPAHMTLDQTQALSHEELPDVLTRRETEVLSLIARGLTDGQVARSLTISANTVHAHLCSIYSKLGVSSRTAAARFAFEIGL